MGIYIYVLVAGQMRSKLKVNGPTVTNSNISLVPAQAETSDSKFCLKLTIAS